jgi:dipeptidyl aminopeptidase/acylaminoacyl peptidase
LATAYERAIIRHIQVFLGRPARLLEIAEPTIPQSGDSSTMKTFARDICAILIALLVMIALPAHAQTKRAMTFDDLISMQRVSDPQISPDGKWVAFTLATPDREANRNASNIWMIPAAGGAAKQLTNSGRDNSPRWSPDGKRVAFISSREGESQIFFIAVEGGEPTRLTSAASGVDNFLWAPDGKSLAFSSGVFPDCKDEACNKKRVDDAAKSKVKAHVYDHLLYRHWTHWNDDRRSHLFIIPTEGGTARDLTPGANYDVPPDFRGEAADIAFAPDSHEICFVADTDPMEAISTNGDLFIVPADGATAPKRITENQGYDGHPVYSPDGKTIAYRAQLVPENEADRWRLMIYDRASGRRTNLSEAFDRSVDNLVWSTDSKTIYFTAEEHAEAPIYAIAAQENSSPRAIVGEGFNGELSYNAAGRMFVFTRSSLMSPAEIFATGAAGGRARQLTHVNDSRLAQIEISKPEWFWFDGAGGTKVHGAVLRPPRFDASKKYPTLLLIHGGPQSAWDDSWTYRWNSQVFAAAGYAVVIVNPRGSTGYGQKFTDEITDDWGGKVYDDLMKGMDYAIANYKFIDGDRVAAAGGSYGGYMVDWIAGHTGRFKALISHAGPYNKTSMYGATEELWFEEHDMAGEPWTNPSSYQKWSPATYAAEFGKYKTPTLVIGGELDFRVPYTQDLEFFSALQRQGVPSKLVIFPDEGHWILKPQNSELWYKTFLDWLGKYLK